ncbi:iron complex outermembrane recepter protein [bacterium A37T11]|nr:iron complex outermembrane recepter protein [bacterium A37T11]
MKINSITLFLLILNLLVFPALAQQVAGQEKGTITGIVKDSTGALISSANVKIKGQPILVKTQEDGSFKLTAPAGRQLIQVSYVGLITQEKDVFVQINENQEITFILGKVSSQLDEVIVSASRRVESLSETPSSVTVIGSKELEALSTISPNLGNILGYAVPGLGSPTNNTGNYGQTLRGRNVLVLIDGIPQTAPLKSAGREIRSIDPSVIERVEVIKGATAIYGNGADGGLINYITKTPHTEKKVGGYTQAGLTGNTEGDSTIGYRFSQQLFGKPNKFDYFVSGMYEKTGVFRDAKGEVISPEYGLGETKSYNAYAKLGYDIAKEQRISLMYNYFSSNQDSKYILKSGVYGQSPAIGVRGDRPGEDEGTKYNHNANLEYTNASIFGKTSLTANAYLQDFSTVFSYSTFFYNGGQSVTSTSKKGLRANLNTPFVLSPTLTGDVTYGFDLLNDITEQRLVDGRVYVPKMNMRNLAPYAQLSAKWFDDLNIKVGARMENMHVNIDNYHTLAKGPDGEGSIAVNGGTLNYNAFVMNAGVRYAKFKYFNPFVSYSQAFSIFDLGRVLTSAEEDDISKLETKPVIVNNYEAGFSSQLGKLHLSASYYYSTSKLGSNTIEVNGFFIAERLPERVWGYEAQLDYQILNEWSVGGNYSHVEGRGDKDDDGDFYGDKDVYLKSNRITPDKMTIYTRYGNQKLNVDLNWMYIGNRDRFEPNASGTYAIGEGPIKSFNLWNLALGYKISTAFRANLGVENVFNTAYYPTHSQFYGNNNNYTRGNGRRFNLSVGYSF